MDFNSTIEIIIKDLREIREIIDDFKNYPGVPLLQVELAKSKCKGAEEVISLLKVLKPAYEAAAQNTEMKKSSGEQLIDISEEEPVVEGQTEKVKPVTIRPNKEDTSVKAPESKSVSGEVHDKRLLQDEQTGSQHTEDTKGKKNGNIIFADQFSGTRPTILDKFGDEKENGLSEVIMKNHPVSDLKEAIGINDRFLFIREIFGGNRQAYEEAISKMNGAASFSDAKAILKSCSGEGEENEAMRQLLEIVKRKLPADE